MPVTRLKELLDSQNVKYVSISHSQAFSLEQPDGILEPVWLYADDDRPVGLV